MMHGQKNIKFQFVVRYSPNHMKLYSQREQTEK